MMTTSDDNNKGGTTDSLIAALTAASPEISFHLDPAGTIIDYHGGCAARTDLLSEAFLGKRLPDISPPELAGLFCTGLSRAHKEAETVAFEFPLQLTTGRVTFEARLIPFSSGKVIAIIRNISRRKRAKEITRLIEERFHTIFRNISVGMVLGAPDGSFIEVNPAFCHFLGYAMDELLKLTVEEITHPDDRKMSRRQRSASLRESNNSYTYEKRYLRKDGSTVWGQVSSNWFHDEDGRPVYAVGLIQDITERKRAEEALRENEERFRRLYSDTPAMLHSIDQNGRLISVSNYWLEVLGYERSEVLGRKSTEFLTEASRRYAEEVVLPEFFKTGFCKDVSYQFLTKRGRLIEVLLSATAERNDSGEIVRSMAVMTDITERKRAEEALRESEEKFSKAFLATPTILVISSLAEGRYIEVNEAFERIMGYCREEVIGRSSLDLNTWEYPQERERMINMLRDEGRIRDQEVNFRDKDGNILVGLYSAERIDLRGEPCLLNLVSDITARRVAEEALRESEEKFSKAFRANPSPLAITTLAEGRIIEINEAFERVFGYRAEESIGRSSMELNIWQYPQDRQRMIRILQSEDRVRNEEITFGDKNGKTIIALYSAELIDLQGEPCLLSMLNDITARKELEEKIEILNTDLACRAFELESVNRELETFSHTVSHDLRSPLTVITGYSELLLEGRGERLDEQSRGYLEHIHDMSLRMGGLINALLDFSRLAHGDMQLETVDLSRLAREISVELQLGAPGRPVDFRIAEGMTVTGDGLLLRAVLQNLLGNAWKYTARNESAEIDFGATESDGVRVYFVRDNGAGFDMRQAEKLFTPFQRLHDEHDFAGRGIGLASVERIIRRHGGRVWATGEIGKGATFFFTLPSA